MLDATQIRSIGRHLIGFDLFDSPAPVRDMDLDAFELNRDTHARAAVDACVSRGILFVCSQSDAVAFVLEGIEQTLVARRKLEQSQWLTRVVGPHEVVHGEVVVVIDGDRYAFLLGEWRDACRSTVLVPVYQDRNEENVLSQRSTLFSKLLSKR